MKKFLKWIKEWFIWLTSKRVAQAINGGASYEEVCEIVKQEMER